ncbi:sulfotransferase family protein [Thiohalorhabdus denitrificans]|uniref:Sulfotransferase family protein n=2 Tax=Thiohalorhabdus denitrificans TaxID=381306 RepID=A0A1G5AN02_9GAMM|nr:sulfotransferase [Thiohalorhabdus denitrificans]SCX79257.1 Sulfotransferase family protein [Thiohalorhabdus denitrificans]
MGNISLLGLPRRIWLKGCRQWGFHQYLSPLVPAPQGRKWVFLVGAYNSGTTLLNTLLGQHPSISTLPYEGVALASKLDRPEDYGWPRMWHKCIEHLGPRPGEGAQVAQRSLREWGMCFDRSKLVFVEKSIVNAVRIPWLIQHFQPAYFIHMVRNGYAVAEGIQRRTNGQAPGGQYSIADCAYQWAEANRIVRESLVEYPRALTVYYEDLAEDPLAQLARIAAFLELDNEWTSNISELKVHGVTAPLNNQNPRRLARLCQGDLEAIEAAAGEELARYGYGRPIPTGKREE